MKIVFMLKYFCNRFGNEKLPKVSLKQRIVERSKGTGAALKSKLKRKRKEQDEKHQSHPTAGKP